MRGLWNINFVLTECQNGAVRITSWYTKFNRSPAFWLDTSSIDRIVDIERKKRKKERGKSRGPILRWQRRKVDPCFLYFRLFLNSTVFSFPSFFQCQYFFFTYEQNNWALWPFWVNCLVRAKGPIKSSMVSASILSESYAWQKNISLKTLNTEELPLVLIRPSVYSTAKTQEGMVTAETERRAIMGSHCHLQSR